MLRETPVALDAAFQQRVEQHKSTGCVRTLLVGLYRRGEADSAQPAGRIPVNLISACVQYK